MNILEEALTIAEEAWNKTETEIERVKTAVLASQAPEWSIASIHVYHCFEGYRAYNVTLWKNDGIKDGMAYIHLKSILVNFDEKTQRYTLIFVEKVG